MKMPYIQFYCRDWMGEQGLQRLGYAERGLWIELLCLMATGDEYGYLTNGGKPLTPAEIARLTRGDKQEVEQLLQHLLEQNVYSTDARGVIFSRRMVKDAHIRTVRTEAGKAGAAAKNQKEHQNPEPREPEPRTHSLPAILPKQMPKQMPKQNTPPAACGKYTDTIVAILNARPETSSMNVNDITTLLRQSEDAGRDWKKLATEWIMDTANALKPWDNPIGKLRAYLQHEPRPAAGNRFKEPARPVSRFDQVVLGNSTVKKYALELLNATPDTEPTILHRAEDILSPPEFENVKRYVAQLKAEGVGR